MTGLSCAIRLLAVACLLVFTICRRFLRNVRTFFGAGLMRSFRVLPDMLSQEIEAVLEVGDMGFRLGVQTTFVEKVFHQRLTSCSSTACELPQIMKSSQYLTRFTLARWARLVFGG